MEISNILTIYEDLTDEEKQLISDNTFKRKVQKGTLLYNGKDKCLGLILILSGQIRAYISSEDGREITLYRLLDNDICLMSASCAMKNIQFDVMLSAEKDTEVLVIPTEIYKRIADNSLELTKYINDLMASRFSEVMWLMEQVMWKSMDKRLAGFLLDESSLQGGYAMKITHEMIASHLGTAREVVTRMLKYMQSENLIELSRGTVTILDYEGLIKAAGDE